MCFNRYNEKDRSCLCVAVHLGAKMCSDMQNPCILESKEEALHV